ncbi:MAG TPA: daunorubicin ABC transporter ATP-binding protein [Deltaproteobacteria bacterium]|nr:MAG: hypothetical protein A2Z79_07240 [Deltaproteobacteria bacterium GWA2_55_82]OIJ74964.1 MAG: hypothetical protein A2V21_312215 [Deltaproteobacteria bacterium GWC2_55_46]HBG47382.1 daunorubicin ABC transporter ATP-binding protein [Deltaproteobacteria bacterium]
MDTVAVSGLKKSYDGFTAVDGVSFSIGRGEIFGLLGPNGAGKTTTIKMLSGLSRSSSGDVKIMGRDVVRKTLEVKRLIGVVPETSNLYPELTSLENLVFAGRLYGMKTAEARAKAEELLRVFGLEEKRNAPFGSLSGGMKRRLTVAASLIHEPPVLFLDEPTTGLDVMSARGLREIIQSLKGRGTTILLTTHYIDEADRLCDRVGIIVKGKIIAIDTPDGLKKSIAAKKAVDIKIVAPGPEVEDRLRLLAGNAYEVERRERFYRFHVGNINSFLAEFSALARDNGLEIESIDTVTPSLEDAFVEITGLHREVMVEEKHAH